MKVEKDTLLPAGMIILLSWVFLNLLLFPSLHSLTVPHRPVYTSALQCRWFTYPLYNFIAHQLRSQRLHNAPLLFSGVGLSLWYEWYQEKSLIWIKQRVAGSILKLRGWQIKKNNNEIMFSNNQEEKNHNKYSRPDCSTAWEGEG